MGKPGRLKNVPNRNLYYLLLDHEDITNVLCRIKSNELFKYYEKKYNWSRYKIINLISMDYIFEYNDMEGVWIEDE